MNLYFQKALKTVGILIAIIIIASGMYIGYILYAINNLVYKVPPEDMIREFNQNSIAFLAVAEYLKKTPNDTWVRKNYEGNIEFEVFNNHNKVSTQPISDEQIMTRVNMILYKIKFGLIRRRTFEMIDEEENGVFFRRSTDFRHSQGIAYSKDGKVPNDGFVKHHRNLGKGWYYFEGE